MAPGVETEELRRYVVRLDDEAGRILGTGFFVAPRWVLTCAHVVAAATRVLVVPDPSVGGSPVPALTEAASPAPAAGGGRQLWPFPDLALVHLTEDLEHPCALLGADAPEPGVDLQAWGFTRRGARAVPEGSPATFRFEGREADGYLKLKEGQAAAGLSGAPLVCPRQRAVVGVVAATRQEEGDLGAYATPVASLLSGGAHLPVELTAHGALIQAMNPRAVVAAGRGWHRVLPRNDVDGLVRQPWTRYTRGARSSPSDLLRPEFGVVPYLFREESIADVLAWCDGPAPMSIARIWGGGGSGKTRFALELCKRLSERGWLAGFWRRDRDAAQAPLPRLVVVDYAEVAELRPAFDSFDDLRRSATEIAPVRVLLLNRTAGDARDTEAIRGSAPASLLTVLDSDLEIDGIGRPLDTAERRELYLAARASFTEAWGTPPGTDSGKEAAGAAPAPDLSADRYGAPLEVLFEALDSALGVDRPEAGGPAAPVERVLEHERTYWRRSGGELDARLQECCAALSTLAGAAGDEQAHALLRVLPELSGDGAAPERQRHIQWLGNLYGGPGRLNPVRPDRLGEFLVTRVLHQRHDSSSVVAALLALPDNGQVAHVLDMLARLVAADETINRLVQAALASRYDDLRRRTVRHGAPTAVAEALDRLTVALGVEEKHEGVKQQEAQAANAVARRRADEEQASRDYSDTRTQLDRLAEEARAEDAEKKPIYQLENRETAAEREHRLVRERVAQLETELTQLADELAAARDFRRSAEDELSRLQNERTDLDKLVALKQELERQLRQRIRAMQNEQRQRGEARRAEEQHRDEEIRRQLETQFERAQHEAEARERAQRELDALRREHRQLEGYWLQQTQSAKHEQDLREQAERDLGEARMRAVAAERGLDEANGRAERYRRDHTEVLAKNARLSRARTLLTVVAVVAGILAVGLALAALS